MPGPNRHPRLARRRPALRPTEPQPPAPAGIKPILLALTFVAASPWPCANPRCAAPDRVIRPGQAAAREALDGEYYHQICAVPVSGAYAAEAV